MDLRYIGRRSNRIVTAGYYDLTTALSSDFTFTRASTGWYFNSSGVLTSAATDVPRFDYNVNTLAAVGLRVEAAATNAIRNASAGGASAGTPGTAPTNWNVTGTANNVTREIVGTGTEDGIPYVDIRYSGTPSASSTFSVFYEANTQIPAANGEIWVQSEYIRLVAGALTNLTNVRQAISMRDGAGSQITSFVANITPTAAALKTNRFDNAATLNSASAAYVNSFFIASYTSGQAIDATFRLGLPQLVKAAAATSSIVTTTTAVTRAADVCTITTPATLYMPSYVLHGRTAKTTSSVNIQPLWQVDDGTANNRRCIRRKTDGHLYFTVTNGGVDQCDIDLGAIADSTDFKVAVRAGDNDFAACLNGGTVQTDTSGTDVSGLTTGRLGANTASQYWNGAISRLELWPGLTNALLQSRST